MNKSEFKRSMQQGLGRCVLTLKQAHNIEKYRDIVLWGCLHNLSYDTQCEGTRAAYVYELVSYFHDDEYFALPTVAAFLKLPRRSDWTFSHFCELLELFAENGSIPAKDALLQKYDLLLSKLISKRHFRGHDCERDQFERLCISLTSLDGTEAFLKITDDMGRLFKENRHYDGGDFDWFYAYSKGKFGDKKLERLLSRNAKRSENIGCFSEMQKNAEQALNDILHEPLEVPAFDQVTAEIRETGKLSPVSKIRFSKRMSVNEKAALAHRALDERDLSVKAQILSIFASGDHDFPFRHEAIIEYSKSDHQDLREEALDVLINCKSDVVRQYAYELLDAQVNTEFALQMLITNYTPRHKSILLSELNRIRVDYESESGWHRIGSKILDAFGKKIRLPKECLSYIYETTLCSCCRAYAIRELARHRWLTADIIEECRYDSNYEIADYIDRYYPKK